jgi:hypothetical protein
VSWPAVLLWALIVPTMLSNGPALLYMLSIVGVFMSLQMLPGDGGGANLLPPTIYAAALVLKVAFGRGNLMRATEAALEPRRLGLFTAFIAYGVVTALMLPRMFAGLVEVIPVSGTDLTGSSLLRPRSGNITQTCYMMISYLTAVAFSVIGSRRDVRYHYMQALVWGGFALVFTGILDLVSYRVGISGLLDPFRTAQYALLTDVEAAGAKRVVGLTSEASTYGALCINAATAILFLRPLYPRGGRRIAATLAVLSLLVMAALSTSATAFAGGAALGCLYVVDLARRYLDRKAVGRAGLSLEIGAVAGVAIVGLAIVLLFPERVAPLFEVVDKIVFQKTASLSYRQRSLWTHVGWQAFLDSGGLGVGLGSIRTSNWEVSILGSTGLFGGFLIFGFLAQRLASSTKHLPPEEAAFATALKLSLPPFLVMSSLAGTIPDIGIGVATILGLLSSGMAALEKRGELRPTPAIAFRIDGSSRPPNETGRRPRKSADLSS